MTQRALGERLGVGQTAIANYEQGSRSPDPRSLQKLANILSVTVDDLLGHALRPNAPHATLRPCETLADLDISYEIDTYINLILYNRPVAAIDRIINIADLGVSVQKIYRDILEPITARAMEMIKSQQCTIHQEFSLAQSLTSSMGILQKYVVRRAANEKSFLGITVGNDSHNIGLIMICNFMHMEGWDVWCLDKFSPDRLQAITVFKPDVLGISVTVAEHILEAEELICAVKRYQRHPLIMVGGQAFAADPQLWRKINADAFAAGGVSAAGLLARLI